MPFYRINGMTMHMRGTKLPPACRALIGIEGQQRVCMVISGFLCDWPDGGGHTCDAPLCEAHATQVGKNKHFCPAHFADHQRVQPGLFTGLVGSAL